jgi:hypothetical protein
MRYVGCISDIAKRPKLPGVNFYTSNSKYALTYQSVNFGSIPISLELAADASSLSCTLLIALLFSLLNYDDPLSFFLRVLHVKHFHLFLIVLQGNTLVLSATSEGISFLISIFIMKASNEGRTLIGLLRGNALFGFFFSLIFVDRGSVEQKAL